MTRRSKAEILGIDPEAIAPRPEKTGQPPTTSGRGSDSALVGGAYEGASRTNRDIALWAPPLRSANVEIMGDRDTAVGRARDVLRNDAYVHSGQNLHKDSIVGSMFLLNCKPLSNVLGIDDDEWETEFAEEVETKFTLYAESPDNWIDAARMNTLTELVRLAVGVYLYGGEVLASAEWLRQSDRPYNTAVQMIEADRLANPVGLIENDRLIGGVERDRFGAPIAYHIRDAHPSDLITVGKNPWKHTRYPARMRWGRTRIIHILEQHRIDQARGISEMVNALKEMRVTKKFRDVVLQNAVVNATYAASIESDLPDAKYAFEQIGGGEPEALTAYSNAYLGAVAEFAAGSKNMVIDGVRIPHLYPGTKLQLRPAGQGGPLGTDFESSLLRYIAANLGVSYEQLSRDYSKTNYSSARAGMLETWKFMNSRKKAIADKFATHVFRLWFEEAVNRGEIETMRGRPDFYEGMNKDAYTNCEWLGAPRGQIDELKETQAAALRMKSNLSTLEEELGRQGRDWRTVLKQIARERALMEELDIMPEASEMMNAVAGATNEQEQDDDDEE